MTATPTQNFNPNPDAAVFSAASPVFSVPGNRGWENEQFSTFPVNPEWISQCAVGTPAPVGAREGRFAIVTVATVSLTTQWLEHLSAAGDFRSPAAWNRDREAALQLTGDRELLANCRITVAGMMDAVRRNRLRFSTLEIRPVRNAVKALPTGRRICLQHQLWNL